MPALQLYTSDQWNTVQSVALQANSSTPIDVTIGSPDLAIIEASTSAFLYTQAQIVIWLARTRASTSEGVYLDSWFADFNFPRLPAKAATTPSVQLSRDNPGIAIVIPLGETVLSSDGTQTYTIIADTSQPAYNATNNNYVMNATQTSILVSVRANTPGSVGNQDIGGISLNGSITQGINTVTNLQALTNGLDTESDQAYRNRFTNYLQSLSRGTIQSIESAIESVQQNIQYSIANNQDTAGNFLPGNFVVTVDDGTGSPPDSLITAVDTLMTAYQGNTISHNVVKPIIEGATIALGFTAKAGYSKATLIPIVYNAVANFVNSTILNTNLSYTKISQAAYNASPGVDNVYDVMLNGGIDDLLVPTVTQRYTIKLASLNVSL